MKFPAVSATLFSLGLMLAAPPLLAADTATSALPANAVRIDNFAFTPASLTVAVGTTVTWVNYDDIPHTVVSSDTPRHFKSPPLDTDGRYSFTFSKPGTYQYFCSIHPHMVGQIVVR
jgi:plastocyanin